MRKGIQTLIKTNQVILSDKVDLGSKKMIRDGKEHYQQKDQSLKKTQQSYMCVLAPNKSTTKSDEKTDRTKRSRSTKIFQDLNIPFSVFDKTIRKLIRIQKNSSAGDRT